MSEKEATAQEGILRMHPELQGLYIPVAGEVINWGKGNAVVVESPLDDFNSPLMVISLNGGIHGPLRVDRCLGMGPIVPLSMELQDQVIDNYDRNFSGRFTTLIDRFPQVREIREKYIESQSERTPISSLE